MHDTSSNLSSMPTSCNPVFPVHLNSSKQDLYTLTKHNDPCCIMWRPDRSRRLSAAASSQRRELKLHPQVVNKQALRCCRVLQPAECDLGGEL